MGSYLVVNGHENNSKGVSSPMIQLMRRVLPEKNGLTGDRVFALSQEEVAETLKYAVMLAENKYGCLAEYLEEHSDDYGLDQGLEDAQETFGRIEGILAMTLSEMVLGDESAIVCEWV